MAAPPPPLNATQIIALKGIDYYSEYCGRSLVNTCIAFVVLNTVFVALRFVARFMSRGRLWWDDWLILPAFLCCIALAAEGFVLVNHGGVGFHQLRVINENPKGLVLWIKFVVVGPFLYTFGVLFAKATILCVYLRVFTERPYRIACYILIGVHVVQTLIVCIMDVAQCQPLAFLWDPTIKGGKCTINANLLFRWASFPNILTDVVMLLLPLPYVWKLHASLQIKTALALTLATGSVGLITSIVRFVLFFDSQVVEDGTWTSSRLIALTLVEVSMYLISGCLPIYRPLYFWCRRSLGLSTGETAFASSAGGSKGTHGPSTGGIPSHASYHSQRSSDGPFEKSFGKEGLEFSVLESQHGHPERSPVSAEYPRRELP